MNIIDSNGEYVYVDGTKMLASSDHPVFKARIEVALPKGAWLYAPNAGHELTRFQRQAKTNAKVEEFQKELKLYLKPYGPVVTDRLLARDAVSMNLQIAEDALNV